MSYRDVPSRFRLSFNDRQVPAPPDDYLQRLAAGMRRDYYQRRHFMLRDATDGRVLPVDGPTPTVYDLWGWRRIAWQCAARLTSPACFLDAQFPHGGEYHPYLPPSPSRLLGQTAWKRYENWHAVMEESRLVQLHTNWESMRRKARTKVVVYTRAGDATREQAVKRVLYDDWLELTPLFRYSLACSMGFEMLAREHEVGAAIDFVRDRQEYCRLNEKMGERGFLPAGFAERAPEIYNSTFPSFGEAPWDSAPWCYWWPRQFA